MNKQAVLSTIAKIVLTAAILAAACLAGVFGLFVAAFTISNQIIVGVLGFLYAIVVLSSCVALWSKPYRKMAGLVILFALIAAAIVLGGFFTYEAYIDSIPTLEEYGGNNSLTANLLNDYEPFKGEKVARLNEPSTLDISKDLPAIDCATALYPVAAAFVEAAYPEGDYSEQRVKGAGSDPALQCSGTGEAYDRLIKGGVDILFAAGPSDEQIAAAEARGTELILTPIGREAFVFFVNSQNPVESLTVEQIQGIYSGEIKSWKELGGSGGSILAYQRNAGSGSQTALLRLMGGKALMSAPKDRKLGGMGGIIDAVSSYKNFKNAIGFSFRFYSTELVQEDEIRLLAINGVYPDKDTIRNGEYPVTAQFYAVTTNRSNPQVKPFVDWILSPQGQCLIEETGYVGV